MNRDRERALQVLRETKLIGSVRVSDPGALPKLAEALIEAGVRFVDVAATTPMAATVIHDLRGRFGGTAYIGAGGVTAMGEAETMLDAGADFLATPIVAPMVAARCRGAGAFSIIGAFTPSEVNAAHAAQADFVGIFPASGLGPGYLSILRVGFPRVACIPFGGLTQESVPAWLNAGAHAVTVGSRLYDREAVRNEDWARVSAHAQQFVAAVRAAGQAADTRRLQRGPDEDTLIGG